MNDKPKPGYSLPWIVVVILVLVMLWALLTWWWPKAG